VLPAKRVFDELSKKVWSILATLNTTIWNLKSQPITGAFVTGAPLAERLSGHE
jgi:hypothetical protein